jgi:hypothetical protein
MIFTCENETKKVNRRHSVSIAFPVKLAEATSVKQAYRWPCESLKTGKISSKVF